MGLGIANPWQARLKNWLIPPLRAYLRYAPWKAGKAALWDRVVDPYLAWHPHGFVARTVFGSKMTGVTTEFLQQYIYYFGIWEPQITRWIRRRLRCGDTFVDVGANAGYYSLLASRLVGPTGSVVSVEASPRIFRELLANLDCNHAANVRTVNAAASDGPGTVKLFGGPESHTGLSTLVADAGLPFECEVEAATLSALLQPSEIETARLVKIDVEGMEWAVAAGMAPLLRRGRPDLEVLVEVHTEHLARSGKRVEDVFRVFEDAGFRAYALENDYSAASYLAGHTEPRPQRIRAPILCETNVVFSRLESATL